MILEVDSLRVSYGETQVINELSLTCREDEILAVLGRNGMGKTTLLKAVIGGLPVDGGTITFEGEDITDTPPHRRAKMGITLIPQGRDIFPDLTVTENLRMGEFAAADRSPVPRDRIYEYFPILEERRDQKGGTMSGGQQQMLAIARGLITNPSLMLLDEPSEGIQPSIVTEIEEIISEIHRNEGIPTIIVEQNIDLVFSLAHRGYIIENGRVIEEGSIEALQDEQLIKDSIGV